MAAVKKAKSKVAAPDYDGAQRLRYSVSLVRQGGQQFYTLTMPIDVLAETCMVTTRKEDPRKGFQRELDSKRAQEIADYIDKGYGTIPTSIILSAQRTAELRIVGSKTLEFSRVSGAFLILDGQHRVYGFSKAKKSLRVPVVIYNDLSRTAETRLFIDINTKQRPVPSQLLLDIKQLADVETESEILMRDIFDAFASSPNSALKGHMSPSEAAKNKITRVTFNHALRPLLQAFSGRESEEIYEISNAYLAAVSVELSKKSNESLLSKPVIFRSFMAVFKAIAQRVNDKNSGDYSAANFQEIVTPLLANVPISKFQKAGTSWAALRDYLEKRFNEKITF